MSKVLCLLTNCYPYGKGDSFLETEINYLCRDFDKVVIYPAYKYPELRDVPENAFVYDDLLNEKVAPLINKLGTFFSLLFNGWFWKEVLLHIKKSKLDRANIQRLIRFTRLSQFKSQILLDKVYKEYQDSEITMYSYWFVTQAMAAALLKNKNGNLKVVSRTHEYDLYEKGSNTLPYRKYMSDNMDWIIPIAEDGVQYLQSRYGIPESKIKQFNLGVSRLSKDLDVSKTAEKFKLLSVAFLSERKRIHLIAEALQVLDKKNLSKKIEWIHVGGGDSKWMSLIEKCIESYSDQIAVDLKGNFTNTQIKELYNTQKDISCFINVSSSEGKPVSIMEAQSYGIPVVATQVGGVAEIVNNENGILLSANPSAQEVADAIELLFDDGRQQKMAEASLENWKVNYNAEINYSSFSKFLAEFKCVA